MAQDQDNQDKAKWTDKPGAPPNQQTSHIEIRSKVDGQMYAGDFTFKRLTLGDIARQGVTQARLNGGLPVDDTTEHLNRMFATLIVGVVKAPEWWHPEDFFDGLLAKAVYEKFLEYQASFRPAVPEPPPAS